ncbi:uncharacterized protein F4812DRAFT_2581 [Daldinia caldariorum]|uniref:uncharacterized protein n=1 Tax=Daldinia caldariorum TaxID=326644 RepID=UPI00200737F4|nr:uncharacterized protein F4812DRAFT_2581 [Daldinia caldariorum]KAI1472209.1 hypothetical protein F4812DRAFT_2581 [Daldinia caldariorum]
MNEGSYNNVVRNNSLFSPMTPSTPNTYKANVNRTKTRKWVEAKVQSYDGDDWGNEYEDEYGDPEPEPEPAPRVAALRQQANTQQPRTFSHSSVGMVSSSNRLGPFGTRDSNGPPSLHIETGSNSGPRAVDTTTSADQGSTSSRFPPRDTSRTREESRINDRNTPEPDSRLWTQRISSSPTKPSDLVRSSDHYNRPGEEREKDGRTIESGGLTVEGSYGRNNMLEPQGEPTNQGRLSTSPKLPDLARMSGFGDDFFSTAGNYNSQARPGLPTIPDTQQTDGAGNASNELTRLNNERRGTFGISEENNPSSTLAGPKLQPNPQIIMPPLAADSEPNKSNIVNTTNQSATSRPQLPGTWVSETTSVGSGFPTPTEKVEGSGLASLGGAANTNASPISMRHAELSDLEPTTAVRQLPSKYADLDAAAEIRAMRTSKEDFNNSVGKHDEKIASKVIAAGPGYHPTPSSLPPLKTGNHLSSLSNTASLEKQESPEVTGMGLSVLQSRDSPSSSSTRQSATIGSSFAPTAPLNPRRSIIAPAEVVTPTIQEWKSTPSTIDTTSPEKESDKLREEIMKSLSTSPATKPDANTVLDASHAAFDPAPDRLTRESTYLSDVYDDYLAPVEDKSLQETGLLLKQGSGSANYGMGESETEPGQDLQKGNTFPDIRPLSPHRSPEQGNANCQNRFSWENDAGKNALNPAVVIPSVSATPSDSANDSRIGNEPSQATEPNAIATLPSALKARTESRATISHQISDVSSRAAGDLSITSFDSPSPVSQVTDNGHRTQPAAPETSRLSLAEEKEQALVQSSSNTSSIEQHPALTQPVESAVEPPPTLQPAFVTHLSPQPKIMAFRDILNIVSIEQRIQKFDETRTQFYSMDSGLSNWILYMQSQPEHGTDSAMPIGGRTSPGIKSASQQPYRQTYSNSHSPDAPVQRGRAASNNLQNMFTGPTMTNLGSSGAQVGTKSKELLQAAGAFGNKGMKSGMKLFNKGKNKLRGTGDKGLFQ